MKRNLIIFFGMFFWLCASQIDSTQVSVKKIEPKQFAQDFKKDYQSKEFIYETDTQSKGWWDRAMDNLSEFFKSILNIESERSISNTIDIIFKILAVLIILFVIYKIVLLFLNKEGQWIFGQKQNQNIMRVDDLDIDINQTDFKEVIKNSIQSKNFRLATRFYYLWLLKKLSDNQHLDWDPEKTNSDYINELKGSGFENDFKYHSYLYDYVWYGGFELSEEVFSSTKTSFETLINKLK